MLFVVSACVLCISGSMDGDRLRTSPSGMGTTGDFDYIIHDKKLILTDSAGTVTSNFTSGKILAADLVIMFLSADCRAEEPHGDCLALAYRLRKSMKCAFILPKMDLWIQSNYRGREHLLVGEEVLARAHESMARDLVGKLILSVKRCNIEIAPDMQVLMRLNEDDKVDKVRSIVELRCFFSQKNYDTGSEAFPYSLPVVMQEIMKRERQALVNFMWQT
eukprot:SM000408S15244  [mRNA]  locus=s408:2869:3784:+ [translate_table: standard]